MASSIGDGIDVSELNALTVRLGELGARGSAMARAVLAKTAADIARDAKIFAPVDTGNLRNSISASVSEFSAEIGPTANYGAYVEFGTSRQAPAAYLGPAFDRNVPGFTAALGMIAGRALGGD